MAFPECANGSQKRRQGAREQIERRATGAGGEVLGAAAEGFAGGGGALDAGVEVGTVVVDIPESQSFFEDGTFRNDNEAHKGATFLIDLRADGQGKKQHWTLLAFSIK